MSHTVIFCICGIGVFGGMIASGWYGFGGRFCHTGAFVLRGGICRGRQFADIYDRPFRDCGGCDSFGTGNIENTIGHIANSNIETDDTFMHLGGVDICNTE